MTKGQTALVIVTAIATVIVFGLPVWDALAAVLACAVTALLLHHFSP